MMRSFLLLGLYCLVSAQNSTTSEIVPLLRNASLVPSIVPAFNATIGPFYITYPSGIVNYGDSLSLATTRYNPDIQFESEASFPNAKCKHVP